MHAAAAQSPLTAAVIRGSSVYSHGAAVRRLSRPSSGRPVDAARAPSGDRRRGGPLRARPAARAPSARPAADAARAGQSCGSTVAGAADHRGRRRRAMPARIQQRLDGAFVRSSSGCSPSAAAEVQRVLGRDARSSRARRWWPNTRRDGGSEQRPNRARRSTPAFDPVDGVSSASAIAAPRQIGIRPSSTASGVANGWLDRAVRSSELARHRRDRRRRVSAASARSSTHRSTRSGTRAFLLAFGIAPPSRARPPRRPRTQYLRERRRRCASHTRWRAAARDEPLARRRRSTPRTSADPPRPRSSCARSGCASSSSAPARAPRLGDRTQYDATLELRQGHRRARAAACRPQDLADDPRSSTIFLRRGSCSSRSSRASATPGRSARTCWRQHSAQYVLPYSERFKVGGERLGRGFEVSEIAGDRGAGCQARAAPQLRRRNARSRCKPPRRTRFYDIGATWTQDVGGRESAATAGSRRRPRRRGVTPVISSWRSH